ncbi:MAG: hypothetical protein ABSD48_00145 [Armatimonadota bacterium]
MRRSAAAVVAAVLCMLVSAGIAWGENPARSPASLVPAGPGYYVEVNLDGILGKTPDTAAFGQAFANLQSIKVIRGLVAQNADAQKGFDETLLVLNGVTEALGPRIAVAVWLPDMASVLKGAPGMFGASAVTAVAPNGDDSDSDEASGDSLAMTPKVLVVADVRDGAKLDALLAQELPKATGLSAEAGPPYADAKVTLFADGKAALAQGSDWLAFGFPADLMKAAADRAAGKATDGSLASDPKYQQAMAGLPEGGLMHGYLSGALLKQLQAAVTLMSPSTTFPPPAEAGLGWTYGLRVDEKQGRRMVTFSSTTDLDAWVQIMDTTISLYAGIVSAALQGSRGGGAMAGCLSHMKSLSMAAQMFATDYDRFPDAKTWVDDLQEYVGDESVYKCPQDKSGARSSYGMNAAMSKMPVTKIKNPVATVVFYETAHPGDCPSGGAKDVVTPLRHPEGNSYGFADGHASRLKTTPSFTVATAKQQPKPKAKPKAKTTRRSSG